MTASSRAHVSFAEYLEAEAAAEQKHEWCNGVVYAMSRGTPEHGRLCGRITLAIGRVLAADCDVYNSDTMVHIADATLSTYADLSVIRGPRETIVVKKHGKSLGEAITNPVIVVEVLSEATERYDRDGRFVAYRQLASLEEYVLVAQDEPRIEVFRRAQNWQGESAGTDENIAIHGGQVSVDDVYR